jgi:hypothetical protein
MFSFGDDDEEEMTLYASLIWRARCTEDDTTLFDTGNNPNLVVIACWLEALSSWSSWLAFAITLSLWILLLRGGSFHNSFDSTMSLKALLTDDADLIE